MVEVIVYELAEATGGKATRLANLIYIVDDVESCALWCDERMI